MREVWGTFSVKDHLRDHAFEAESLLYDRLVIPVPPPRDRDEWQRWKDEEDWDPDRLAMTLESLGDKAHPVPWDAERKKNWARIMDAAQEVEDIHDYAFFATRVELTRDLPAHVTGVLGVASYPSRTTLAAELGLEELGEDAVGGGTLTAVFGREFFQPVEVGDGAPQRDVLRAAAELSQDDSVALARRNYWRWLREFVTEAGLTEEAAEAALKEMKGLVEEENARFDAIAREQNVRTTKRYAFLLINLAMLAAPPPAKMASSAFMSIGNFMLGGRDATPSPEPNSPGALFVAPSRDMGWRS